MARQLLTLGIGVAPHRSAWEGVAWGRGGLECSLNSGTASPALLAFNSHELIVSRIERIRAVRCDAGARAYSYSCSACLKRRSGLKKQQLCLLYGII